MKLEGGIILGARPNWADQGPIMFMIFDRFFDNWALVWLIFG